MIAFSQPLVLLALPLALLPLLGRWLRAADLPRLDLRPSDSPSIVINHGLTATGILAIAALIVGISGPHLSGGAETYTGTGTNLVLLIDRSSSMNDTFAGRTPKGNEESKAAAARRILSDFIAKRPDDRIGLAAFSTAPMTVLPLTNSRSAVAGAIAALDERGLSQTDVGRGLALALSMMDDATAIGSRAVLLVSDGAGVIAPEVQKALRALARRQPVNLYWIYLRTKGAKSLFEVPPPGEPDTPQLRPERHLHLFLQRLAIPYRAFEAESPDAVPQAIAAIDKLERRAIVTQRTIARRDLDWIAFITAALASSVLAFARWLERPYSFVEPLPPMVSS
ncbi:vWA domain-containing protein [Breoghania sp.]|uniref:vWA domain-containing protein n=1 Tax=Breoghania sp. TaxID=2065378 RepID=UPI002AA8CDDF|nr:vWA domain-containing protein [Breoghania sp.]